MSGSFILARQIETKAEIDKLISEGKKEEAVMLGDEAEALGIIRKDKDGNIILPTASEGKEFDKPSWLDRIKHSLGSN